ncbi:hypothetical protein N9L19_00985 [bacterium]|nr:hypothetical protein [bacterium]
MCQAWLTRDWASSGRLLVCDAVEKELGDRLRLGEYKHSFVDDAAAQIISDVLLQRLPPVHVSGPVLRLWFFNSHPESSAWCYDSAAGLRHGMGGAIRREYAGLGYKALRFALRERRKAIEVSQKVCQTSLTQHGASEPEAADASGAASPSGSVIKLVAAKAVEEVVGTRYRRGATDLGLRVTPRDMVRMLLTWGYQVSREAYQELP